MLMYFFGMISGFVLTVFLSLWAMHYIRIEESKKKYDESKLGDQDNHINTVPIHPIFEGGDVE